MHILIASIVVTFEIQPRFIKKKQMKITNFRCLNFHLKFVIFV
jgi:hypothetical protein